MIPLTRRMIKTMLVFGALVLPAEFYVLSVVSAGRSVEDVWASRLTPTAREKALRNISAYPESFRRELYRTLSPEQQATAWRIVAENYLESHPSADAREQALISRAISLYTRDTFEERPEQSLAELRSVLEAVRATFSPEAARELFFTLGPQASSTAALPWRTRLEIAIRRFSTAEAFFTNCNCNTDIPSEDCSGQTWLCSELQGCDFWYVGCGMNWLSFCNGYCIDPEV